MYGTLLLIYCTCCQIYTEKCVLKVQKLGSFKNKTEVDRPKLQRKKERKHINFNFDVYFFVLCRPNFPVHISFTAFQPFIPISLGAWRVSL